MTGLTELWLVAAWAHALAALTLLLRLFRALLGGAL
jgi:hypothetical protein